MVLPEVKILRTVFLKNALNHNVYAVVIKKNRKILTIFSLLPVTSFEVECFCSK